MSKISILFPLFIMMFFSACISSPEPEIKEIEVSKNKKVFENEDALIMFALRAEQLRDYESATKFFNILYTKSNKKEYLYRSLENMLVLKSNQAVILKVDEIAKGTIKDFDLIRLKIVALVQLNRLDDAKLLAISLVEKSKKVDDYILVSDIYVRQNEFDLAVKYLESAYLKNYNEKILDKMLIVLYVNLNRKKEAIAQLETHVRVHGCSVTLCKRLMAFYSNDNNIDGLLSAYLRYYKIDSNSEIAKKIVQIYEYKKEYMQLVLFLEESGSDDKTLLELYASMKNYKKAYPLAQKIYDESGESRYLGDSILYEYESQKDKNVKVFLDKISKRFEELLLQDRKTLYLNYYGYILIDHDLDVKKGIRLVNEALHSKPNSAFYLDSLAWGYYKQGKCKEALSVIEKVITLKGGDDPEVIKHYKIIKKCKGKK